MTGKKSGGTPFDGGAAPQKRTGYELSGGAVGRCALLAEVPGAVQTARDLRLHHQLRQLRRHVMHEQDSVFLIDFCNND